MRIALRLAASVMVPVVLLAARCVQSGQDGPDSAYVNRAPDHEDGTGRFYMGREIAQVLETEHRIDRPDSPDRDVRDLPDRLVAALGLKPADRVADIGSGAGYYTLRERPFAVGTFLFGFLALWVVPIFVGVFCRGPGWNWYWPWESWDIEKTHDMTTRNLTDLVGLGDGGLAMFAGGLCVLAWYGLGWLAWLKRERMAPLRQLDGLRFSIVAFLFLSMAAIPLKIALRLALDIKYVCVTPWFNI